MVAALILIALYVLCCLVPVTVGMAVLAADRGRPVRPTRAGISLLARETAAHVLVLAVLPFGLFQFGPRPWSSADSDRTPVLLVPGYTMNRLSLWFLASYLRRRGIRWVWGINNRPFSSRTRTYARALDAHVDRLRRASGSDKVDLVCHSMGGVIANLYLREFGGASKVRRLVTIGTPYNGTKMAVFGFRREARDLYPDSTILAGLDAPGVPAHHIWSTTDHVVVPPDSCIPRWAAAAQVQRFEGIGHMELLISARIYQAVHASLSAAPGELLEQAEVEPPAATLPQAEPSPA